MSEEARTSRVPGWLLPVGLVALVVGLVAIALSRGPTEIDPDTPEGTVQEYLQAINDERFDDAVDVIHPAWRGACEGSDLAGFVDTDFTARLGNESFGGGFVAVPATEEGSSVPLPPTDTTVEVTISHNQGGGIGSSWDEYVVFELIDDDDFWWLGNDPWPYFLWNCREG